MNSQQFSFADWIGLNQTAPAPPDMIESRDWSVISLWEPWASAIALRLKMIETRHWPTKYRGPILIHAAKRPVDYDDFTDEITATMLHHGIEVGRHGRRTIAPYFDGTYGRIIAYAELIDCVETEKLFPSVPESAWGNYAPGRFGWVFTNIRPIVPIPARGYQRIWHYTGPITFKKAA